MEGPTLKLFKRVSTVLAAAVFAGALVGPVLASDNDITTSKIRINAGTLDVWITGGDLQWENYNYTYAPKSVADAFTVKVTDRRGNGAGWVVSIKGTPFTNTGDATHSFPVSSLSLLNPEKEIASDGSGSEPVASFTAKTPTLSGAPQELLTTVGGTRGVGQGSYNVIYDGAIQIPDLTHAGEYQSTITVDIVSAPTSPVVYD